MMSITLTVRLHTYASCSSAAGYLQPVHNALCFNLCAYIDTFRNFFVNQFQTLYPKLKGNTIHRVFTGEYCPGDVE